MVKILEQKLEWIDTTLDEKDQLDSEYPDVTSEEKIETLEDFENRINELEEKFHYYKVYRKTFLLKSNGLLVCCIDFV